MQGYFSGRTRWNAFLAVFPLDTRPNGRYVPGIGITNTTPLCRNFGSLLAIDNLIPFRNLFKRKLALVIYIYVCMLHLCVNVGRLQALDTLANTFTRDYSHEM
jgi:hypothetical protein